MKRSFSTVMEDTGGTEISLWTKEIVTDFYVLLTVRLSISLDSD